MYIPSHVETALVASSGKLMVDMVVEQYSMTKQELWEGNLVK